LKILDVRRNLPLRAISLPGFDLEGQWFPDGENVLVAARRAGKINVYKYHVATQRMTRLFPELGTVDRPLLMPSLALGTESQRNVELVPDPGSLDQRPGLAIDAHGVVVARVSSAHDKPGHLSTDGSYADRLAPPTPANGPQSPRVQYFVPRKPGGRRELPIMVREPEGPRPKGGWPTVALIHGGPSVGDMDVYNAREDKFLGLGVAVVRVDYRGSVGYGLPWAQAMTENPVLGELDDIDAALDFLAEKGVSNPKQKLFYGGSWSGGLALVAATRPGWAAVVAEVPVVDYAPQGQLSSLEHSFKFYFENSPTADRSPIHLVDEIAGTAVIMTAALDDPRTPVGPVLELEDKLRQAGAHVEVNTFAGGHTTANRGSDALIEYAAWIVKGGRPGHGRQLAAPDGEPSLTPTAHAVAVHGFTNKRRRHTRTPATAPKWESTGPQRRRGRGR
jgi:dienelactone hydrolase